MFVFFILLLSVILSLVVVNLSSLLSVLILLELASFTVLSLLCVVIIGYISIYYILISLFCFMVVESILGLVGLVLLVSFSGSDYLCSSSLHL